MNSTIIHILLIITFGFPCALHAVADDDFGPWEIIEDEPTENLPTESDSTEVSPLPDNPISIMGEPQIDAAIICQFVSSQNPDFNPEIAEAYLRIGRIYGIRGDVALCQAIIETGWFRFINGTAVRAEQHNYCGLGVTRKGLKGYAFVSVEEGVTAQLQHLYAYATCAPLPDGEVMVDPRFTMVKRGCASTWHDLNGRWAANNHYGTQILNVYKKLCNFVTEKVTNNNEK